MRKESRYIVFNFDRCGYVYKIVENKIDGRFDPRSQCLSIIKGGRVQTLQLKILDLK